MSKMPQMYIVAGEILDKELPVIIIQTMYVFGALCLRTLILLVEAPLICTMMFTFVLILYICIICIGNQVHAMHVRSALIFIAPTG